MGVTMADTNQFTEMEWIKFLGIEPLSVEAGRTVIRLQPRLVHLNHNGTVNAPILYALAEVAGAGSVVAGMLEQAAASYTVVKKASIEYLAPARGAVTADGVLASHFFEQALTDVNAGRPSEAEVPVNIRDSDGALVATAEFTIAIRPRRRTA
jgi:acyl-coenzyme A thioesterase PaaI-like protein